MGSNKPIKISEWKSQMIRFLPTRKIHALKIFLRTSKKNSNRKTLFNGLEPEIPFFEALLNTKELLQQLSGISLWLSSKTFNRCTVSCFCGMELCCRGRGMEFRRYFYANLMPVWNAFHRNDGFSLCWPTGLPWLPGKCGFWPLEAPQLIGKATWGLP